MPVHLDLSPHEITVPVVVRNAPPGRLYEDAVSREQAGIVSSGAIAIRSGAKTGRCPGDKHVVRRPESEADVWWGAVNRPIDEHTFLLNRQRAIDYLNTRDQIYVCDGYAGWDPATRVKVRVLCARAYHALFMHNMLIRPTLDELERFGAPDYVIYNAGQFPANRFTSSMTSRTSIDLCLERREQVILGTEYAGEMKKGVFTYMHWLLPGRGILSMHCSANEGIPPGGGPGDVAVFFGLSGTGKTTLSADPARRLIGDDEHGWGEAGIFNIEGAATPSASTSTRPRSQTSGGRSGSGPCSRTSPTTPRRGRSTSSRVRLPKTPARPTRSTSSTTRRCPVSAPTPAT